MAKPKADWNQAYSEGAFDPDVMRLMLQLSPALLMRSGMTSSIAAWRRNWQLCVKAFASREAVGSVDELSFVADGHEISLRVYTPASQLSEKKRPALLWYHGGGFVAGDLYTAGATCRKLANACGCVVIAASYRLAPENPISAGLSDCVAAFRWLSANADDLGLDAKRIAVGGDSAGGAMAALVAQRCTSARGPKPAAQLLVYPAADLAASFEGEPAGFLNRTFVDLFHWLQSEVSQSGLHDPQYSPVRAKSVAGLPPTIMITAGSDPLRPDAVRYAERLAAAKVPVQIFHFPGQFHGFMSFDRVLSGAQTAFEQIGSALSGLFDGRPMDQELASKTTLAPVCSPWLWMRPSQRVKEASVMWLMLQDAVFGGMGIDRKAAGESALG